MKIPCAVIRDLLPLYAEDLASEESKQVVDEHLADCPDCRARLETLKEPAAPEPDASQALRAVKKEFRRRRVLAVLLAALLVFLPLFALLAHSTDKIAVPYEDGLISVESVENDVMTFSVDGRVSGVDSQLCPDPDNGETTLLLQAWSNSWNESRGLAPERGSYSVSPAPDRVIYGYGTARSDKQELLYGEPMQGGIMLLPRLVLGYYLLYDAVLAVIFVLLWSVKRKTRAGEIFRCLFFATLAYPIGHLMIKGPHTLSFFVPRDLAYILIAAAAVWGLLMLGWTLWKQKRRETV